MRGGPSAERIPGADVDHDNRIVRLHAGVPQSFVNRRNHRRVNRHLDRHGGSIRRRDAERRQQVPLVLHRVARPETPRARDRVRVHPAPSDHGVAEAHARAAQPCQHRRARSAVKINHEVVTARAQPPRECGIVAHAAPAFRPRRDDHLVQMRIVQDDRRGRRLDDVSEVRVGEPPPQSVNRGRGEHDVTNLP